METSATITAVTGLATSVNSMGVSGVLLLFCIYLAYINMRDKKHCEAMMEKVGTLQESTEAILRDVQKQLEIANRLYEETKKSDVEFRSILIGRVESLCKDAQRRRAGDYNKD